MAHTATWHGKTIAESDRTLEVGGYIYFPRDTVRMDLLKSTPKTANDLNARTAFSSMTWSKAMR